MMEDESAEEKGFKVSDRRFSVRGYEDEEASGASDGRRLSSSLDAAGEGASSASAEPRAAASAPRPVRSPRPAPEAGRQAPPAREEAGEGEEEEEDKSFEMLVAIVQTNALAAMGIHPQTGERVGGADPRSSKMFVDLLAALKEKTRGNLSPEEEQLLGRVHSDLQMMYVREVGFA